MRDDRVHVVGVVLDGFAHRAGVGGGEPRQRRPSENAHHARAHDVAESHVREVSDGEGDGVDAVARTERAGQPHEQSHDLSFVGGGP